MKQEIKDLPHIWDISELLRDKEGSKDGAGPLLNLSTPPPCIQGVEE